MRVIYAYQPDEACRFLLIYDRKNSMGAPCKLLEGKVIFCGERYLTRKEERSFMMKGSWSFKTFKYSYLIDLLQDDKMMKAVTPNFVINKLKNYE
jgi:hypothetical protein